MLSDPDRAPDILQILSQISANPQSDTIAIFRNYGENIPKLNRSQNRHLMATIDAKVANMLGLYGIHIPNAHLKAHRKSQCHDLFITTSAHNIHEILRAQRLGIKNMIISPIFPSKSKSAKRIMGKIKLAAITRTFPHLNFIALGGVNLRTIKLLQGIKIHGIAGVSFK